MRTSRALRAAARISSASGAGMACVSRPSISMLSGALWGSSSTPNDLAAVDHERAQRRALRGQRRDDDGVEGRRHRRAAGADRVGRRARGRRDDDAVAAAAPAATRRRPPRAAGPGRSPDRRATTTSLNAITRRAGSAPISATSAVRSSSSASPRARRSSASAQLVAADVRQEADVTEVDAQHGRVLGHRDLQRAQDGAVAAQRDDELAAGVERRSGSALVPRSTTSRPCRAAHAWIVSSCARARAGRLGEHAHRRGLRRRCQRERLACPASVLQVSGAAAPSTSRSPQGAGVRRLEPMRRQPARRPAVALADELQRPAHRLGPRTIGASRRGGPPGRRRTSATRAGAPAAPPAARRSRRSRRSPPRAPAPPPSPAPRRTPSRSRSLPAAQCTTTPPVRVRDVAQRARPPSRAGSGQVSFR